MAELSPADAETRKQRNIAVAVHVGGFLLPLAGMIGAILYYVRGEERTAYTVALASVAGVFTYLILFGTG